MNLNLRSQANLRCAIYVAIAMIGTAQGDGYLHKILPPAVWSVAGVTLAGLIVFRAFIDRSNHVANEAAEANGTQDSPPPPPNPTAAPAVVPVIATSDAGKPAAATERHPLNYYDQTANPPFPNGQGAMPTPRNTPKTTLWNQLTTPLHRA